ncbi:sigma-54-dependent Fis family transcriptional regulator [Calderihabitans maritimus]|uniref:Transcriptional regulator n=1 Tax=Calderihabitans maritimus TaxID=1246530 RepID=A0A1Z5HQA1_9FIRM|nr:sigma 54-interacting transcriptional regulator [Calderihabitans maritimus]GAW91485.1 transcriptional regulator [Calderihabitans maritimus]
MSRLQQVREKGQKVAEAIATVLQAEVEIIDTSLVRVAGTGRVHNDVGSKLLRGFINKYVLKTGKHVFISEAGFHEICQSCPLAGKCFYKASIVYPIYLEQEVIGTISLIAFDDKQRQNMLARADSLIEFIGRMADFISSKVAETELLEEKIVMANQLEALINSVHEGVIAIDRQGRITHFNRSAEKLFRIKKSYILGTDIKQHFEALPLLEVLRDGKGFTSREVYFKFNQQNLHLVCTAKPIKSSEEKIMGVVATFRDFSETQKFAYEILSQQQHALTFDNIIGRSPSIQRVKEQARKIAGSNSTVLIVGESGTGKELFARAIHAASTRAHKPFVAINCGAIPETLLESELFGYEEGAFTGAKRGGKPGKIELANGGTLFLDEISNMSLYLQAKLLRVLQERQIERVGSTRVIPIDIRIVAATNQDLQELVQKGRFREDLFYRLSVIPLIIPPLRERREDIPLLLDYYRQRYSKLLLKEVEGFTREALDLCLNYPWPGNVRELINAVEYAINLEETNYITLDSLPPRMKEHFSKENLINTISENGGSVAPLQELEKEAIRRALHQFGWSEKGKKQAAAALGISRATIYRKIQKYQLHPETGAK